MPNKKMLQLVNLKRNTPLALLNIVNELEQKQLESLKQFQQNILAKIDTRVERISKDVRLKGIDRLNKETVDNTVKEVLKGVLYNIKGDIGEAGKTPIAGKDFPIPKDGKTPVAGKDFPIPKNGKDGKDGIVGERGIQGFIGASGRDGVDGIDAIFPKKEIDDFRKEIIELVKKKMRQLKQFGGQQISGGGFDEVRRYIVDEAPSGTKTSGQLTFTLLNKVADGTLVLYLNGQRLEQGASSDYTISGLTITFVSGREPLDSNENLRADYIKSR